jgi:hypothetical protein
MAGSDRTPRSKTQLFAAIGLVAAVSVLVGVRLWPKESLVHAAKREIGCISHADAGCVLSLMTSEEKKSSVGGLVQNFQIVR